MLAAEKAEHPIAHNLPAFFDADHQLHAESIGDDVWTSIGELSTSSGACVLMNRRTRSIVALSEPLAPAGGATISAFGASRRRRRGLVRCPGVSSGRTRIGVSHGNDRATRCKSPGSLGKGCADTDRPGPGSGPQIQQFRRQISSPERCDVRILRQCPTDWQNTATDTIRRLFEQLASEAPADAVAHMANLSIAR